MPTASWNGAVIAQANSDQVQIVENNVYFPLSAVSQDYLRASGHQTTCPWKGIASYYDLRRRWPGEPERRLVLPRTQG